MAAGKLEEHGWLGERILDRVDGRGGDDGVETSYPQDHLRVHEGREMRGVEVAEDTEDLLAPLWVELEVVRDLLPRPRLAESDAGSMVPEGGCSDREQAWWGQGGSQLGMLRNEVQHSGRHGGQPTHKTKPFKRDIAEYTKPPLCRAPRLNKVAH